LFLPSVESWSSDGPGANWAGQLAFEPGEKRFIAQRSADVRGGSQLRNAFVNGALARRPPPADHPASSIY
jgi:hypothetical protein